jgi:U3 small nucleolar RNA-associated protein 20
VSEAKEVTAFAGKYKEAKRCRAYEAYQHLAAAVTFDTQIQPLLQLVQDKLPSATSPSIRAKLEQLLTAAARGVAINPSVTAEGLAVWLGQELDACLKIEEAARAKAKAAVGAATATGSAAGKRTPKQQSEAAAAAAGGDAEEDEDAESAAAAGDGSQHLYLLVHFCLTVLNGGLKKGVLSGRSAEVLALLDPLLPLLVRCLYSRHLGSVQVGSMFTFPLGPFAPHCSASFSIWATAQAAYHLSCIFRVFLFACTAAMCST